MRMSAMSALASIVVRPVPPLGEGATKRATSLGRRRPRGIGRSRGERAFRISSCAPGGLEESPLGGQPLVEHLGRLQGSSRGAGDDHDVQTRFEQGPRATKRLPHHPLDAVSNDRVTHALGGRDAEARGGVVHLAGGEQQHEGRGRDPAPLPLNPLELRSGTNAALSTKALRLVTTLRASRSALLVRVAGDGPGSSRRRSFADPPKDRSARSEVRFGRAPGSGEPCEGARRGTCAEAAVRERCLTSCR